MNRIAMLLIGLVATAALIVAGCGGESASDRSQEETQSASAGQQEAGASSEQTGEPEQPDQLESVGPSEDREHQQESSERQPQPTEQAETEQDQSQPAQPGDAQQRQAQRVQAERDSEPESKFVIGGERPATLLLPSEVDLSEPRPLILLLHGYGSYASQADQYFQFSSLVDEGGFGLLLPDGTVDEIGNRYWNATPECCDIFGAEPDDVGYMKALIEEARTHAEFDQVFAVGHSNGGFMSYRLACEDVPGLSAIVSLAGGAFANADDCRVPTPLSVLQIHGTDDEIVLYEGGRLPTHPDPDREAVPGAKDSVLRWAERAGCDIDRAGKLPPIDTDTAVAGSETTIVRFADRCAEGTVMDLWTIEGGGHVPSVWDTDFSSGILSWLADRYEGLDSAAEPSATGIEERTIGGERRAQLIAPAERGNGAIPLVLSLHGYEGQAEAHDWYFGLSDRIIDYHFALITPQGSSDDRGNPFWNATDGCCNFYGSAVDDYGWLTGLVEEAREIVKVSEVYVVGYSNGGFMSYRLACDGLDRLVAIASLAGSSFGDPERCAEAAPVSVLQIHGTGDLNIPYAGTLEYDRGYPGAVELIERWARRAGCDEATPVALPNIDLDASIDGAETSVQRIREGCADGVTIELWTLEGGDHFPLFQDDWPDHLLNWLFAESRTD